MSTTTTLELLGAKKRGRPRTAATEDVGTMAAVEVKKPTVRAASTKAGRKEKKVKQEKAAAAAQSAKTGASPKNDAPKTIAPRPTTTPPPPSKILDEVRATGTLSAASARVDTTKKKPGASVDAAVHAHAKTSPPQTLPPQAPPTRSPSAPLEKPPLPPSVKPTPPPSLSATKRAQPQPRTTTIPLPHKPTPAPSPSLLAKPTLSFARPAPPPSSKPQSQPQPQPHPGRPRPSPTARIIEPTPDGCLHPKYKWAARRVTAIIVGIPFLLVIGYELYSRLNGGIRKAFEEEKEKKKGVV